jgi:hypothetical protein
MHPSMLIERTVAVLMVLDELDIRTGDRFGKPPDDALEWARSLIARRIGSSGTSA